MWLEIPTMLPYAEKLTRICTRVQTDYTMSFFYYWEWQTDCAKMSPIWLYFDGGFFPTKLANSNVSSFSKVGRSDYATLRFLLKLLLPFHLNLWIIEAFLGNCEIFPDRSSPDRMRCQGDHNETKPDTFMGTNRHHHSCLWVIFKPIWWKMYWVQAYSLADLIDLVIMIENKIECSKIYGHLTFKYFFLVF